MNAGVSTRDSKYKLDIYTFHYNIRKYSFFVLSKDCKHLEQTSLPNTVVDVDTVKLFKSRLDKFWMHQEVKYDYTAELTGTGNRSEYYN